MKTRTERRVHARAAVAVHATESLGLVVRISAREGEGARALGSCSSSSSSFSFRAHLKTSILLCDDIIAPPDPRQRPRSRL
uniref:Uncharacterized protein n=1 Tax=Arundo donax TaxID=35708 RepID=A0A0A9B950_ARUDO